MHDPADRTTNSSSSIMSASPNRLLNIHSTKLSRPSTQQQNLSKKLKINHMNGVRPTSHEGNSTVRSSLVLHYWVLFYNISF
jgi:hypothetical protein